MRIRKRKVPLPLSSLSPIPVSDPRSPMVQLHQRHDPHQNLSLQADVSFSPPSDHPNQPIGSRTDGFDCSANGQQLKDKDCLVLLQGQGDYARGEEEEAAAAEKKKKSNDTRKNNILGAEIAAAGVLSQLSSSHQVVGRWGEGEKAFPLKKRRGRFERRGEDGEEEKEKKMKTKMKTKMNRKFAGKNGNEEEERETNESIIAAENNTNSGSKKRARGGAIMEGSRCSRVNGRGWRCCQQTLVGYSLCEHHLGKGRLRSMTSVRSRSLGSSAPSKNEKSKQQLLPTLEENKTKREREEEDENDNEKPLMINAKKKMKLGMVKARSISSLLEQKDSEMIASENLQQVARAEFDR